MRSTIAALGGLMLLWGCGGEPETTAPAEPARMEIPRTFVRPAAFPAGGPFTPGVLAGDTLYIAGQVDLDPGTREQPEGAEAQTRRAMDNVGLVLEEAGMDFGNVVSCHVQLVDMDDYAAMNAVYGSYFEEGRYPARTTLEMPGLVGAARIEVTCTAFADKSKIEPVRPSPDVIPPAMGPYSSAVIAGDTIYLSGQGGRNPQTGEIAEGVAEQTAHTLQTIGHILEAAGASHEHTVFANVYYLGPENRADVEVAFAEPFASTGIPSRGMFCLSRLPGTISVEITFTAALDRYAITRLFAPGTPPGGPTPATLAGKTLYASAHSSPGAGESFGAQFRAAMEEQKTRLALADMGMAHVVKAHVYLTDTADFDEMNAIFREYFPENPPARTTVRVRQEAGQAGVQAEVALIAVK